MIGYATRSWPLRIKARLAPDASIPAADRWVGAIARSGRAIPPWLTGAWIRYPPRTAIPDFLRPTLRRPASARFRLPKIPLSSVSLAPAKWTRAIPDNLSTAHHLLALPSGPPHIIWPAPARHIHKGSFRPPW